MQEVWLTYGLSASGKSTWAKARAEETGAVRLSMDDVRATLGCPSGSPLWNREFEGVAFKVMLTMAKAIVGEGKSIILDNTHLAPSMPTQIAKAFRQHDVAFGVRDFTHVPKAECVRRDALRPDGVRVGEEVINRQEKVRRTAKSGGRPFRLTEEWLSSFRLDIKPYQRPPVGSKPRAVIFDVDGTLTTGPKGRSPYEWFKVLNDEPRPFIAHLAQILNTVDRQILVVSGRSDVCRPHTTHWLERYGIRPDRFLMRKAGDNRSDDLVKMELFDAEIRNVYDVEAVFDDRDQVVSMWRKLGLQVLQVADGAF